MDPGERDMEYIRKCIFYMDPGADPGSVEILTIGHVFMGDVEYRAVFARAEGLLEQMKKYLGEVVLDVKDEGKRRVEVFIDGDFARKRGFADDGATNHFLFVEYEAGGVKKGDLVKLKGLKIRDNALIFKGLGINIIQWGRSLDFVLREGWFCFQLYFCS